MDAEYVATPMPREYSNHWVRVLCNDCHAETDTLWHTVGLRCGGPPPAAGAVAAAAAAAAAAASPPDAKGCGGWNTRKCGPARLQHAPVPGQGYGGGPGGIVNAGASIRLNPPAAAWPAYY
jgi:hypothetical protein